MADGPNKLTHFDATGAAVMVDVSGKNVTHRVAKAAGFIRISPQTLKLIRAGTTTKGDVIGVARLAGIMAAKKTSDLIPLCHPLPLSKAELAFDIQPEGIAITATVRVTGQTGVEMEALTAVSIAALTIYDMCKASDKGMRIEDIRLLSKRGGRSGHYEAT